MNSTTFYRVGRLRDGEQRGMVVEVDYFLDATEQIDDWMEQVQYEITAQAPKDYNEKYHRVPTSQWNDEWNAHFARISRFYEAERRLWSEEWDENGNSAVPNAQYVLTADNEIFWIEKVESHAKAS